MSQVEAMEVSPKTPKTPQSGGSEKETDPTPYGVEYARSSRSGCRKCNEKIMKDELRMSVRFESRFFSGYQVQWFHFECFWTERRSKNVTVDKILGFDTIRDEDKERIRERIKSAEEGDNRPTVDTVKVEVAKTGAGKCQGCKVKVNSGELRVQTKAHFHHINCYKANTKLSEGKSASDFDGYKNLDDKNKAIVDAAFPQSAETTKNKTSKSKAKAATVDSNKKKRKTVTAKVEQDENIESEDGETPAKKKEKEVKDMKQETSVSEKRKPKEKTAKPQEKKRERAEVMKAELESGSQELQIEGINAAQDIPKQC